MCRVRRPTARRLCQQLDFELESIVQHTAHSRAANSTFDVCENSAPCVRHAHAFFFGQLISRCDDTPRGRVIRARGGRPHSDLRMYAYFGGVSRVTPPGPAAARHQYTPRVHGAPDTTHAD
eukprot:1280015-Prymnesium_polylepis.1